jgi:serine protease AprX
MHQKLMPRTIRWGGAVAAAATVVAVCVPGAPAQLAVGVGVGSGSHVQAPSDRAAFKNSGFSSGFWGPAKAAVSTANAGTYKPAEDPGSLFTVEKAIGAREVWGKKDRSGRPLTGEGVGVALVDTGANEVPGLDGDNKLIFGPDLSIEGNGRMIYQDTFGHGTYMAGIIAGRGTTVASARLPLAGPEVQLGVAPDASLISLKLANTDGSTDVSEVIAALDFITLDWYTGKDDRVRVVNLAYGTDSTQASMSDPLSAAVENLWKKGIVVVTSAGNGGSGITRMTDPAINPYVIAVGATQDYKVPGAGTSDQTTVAPYSQVGSASRRVDLVAPGTSVVSARAPGSFIDVNFPTGRVAGDATGTLFRGSGTSQAAAVVSGAIAILFQAYPSLTPDQVKFALTSSARPVKTLSPNAGGAGSLDLPRALAVAGQLVAGSVRAPVQAFPRSTGSGSIDAARGGSFLTDVSGKGLTGEIDAQGNTWSGAAWLKAASAGTVWSGGKWLGNTWSGDSWEPVAATAGHWKPGRWTSPRWSAAGWGTADWSSSRWSSSRWSSSRWSDSSWN